MKSFLFKSIWLLSRKERKARFEEFHEKKTLLQGKNHTGKSSIIKNLYLTLGAKPQGELEQWDDSAISLVDFSIDGVTYRALHQSGWRALFDESNKLLLRTDTHAVWSRKFAEIVGFNLVLSDKGGNSVPADPKCFLLPFFINQDGSWGASWETFTGLQQFKTPVKPILEYFSGVRPPEFYTAKAKKDAEQLILENLKKEKMFLDRAQARFGEKLPMSGPKIDPENFKTEIQQLTTRISELNAQQEKLREQSFKERDLLSSINLQINMADEAFKVYEGDAKYLRSETREALICPVCNAEHKESFFDLLTYADDARSLKDITVRLRSDAKDVEVRVKKTASEIAALEKQYQEINQLLASRKGDMHFGEVVSSLGAEQAFKAFEDERSILAGEITKHQEEVDRLAGEMSKFTDKKRSKAILNSYRAAYAWALNELNLPAIQKVAGLSSRPKKSGSGGPRSILAYYAALWSVCLGEYGSYSIPIVVESPNQQGQDADNLPKVIEFVSTKLPDNAQLILGSENEVDFPFDKKIVLDRPYQLLDAAHFDEALALLEPLITQMYSKDLLSVE